jgi:hypothetical protein
VAIDSVSTRRFALAHDPVEPQVRPQSVQVGITSRFARKGFGIDAAGVAQRGRGLVPVTQLGVGAGQIERSLTEARVD